MVFDLASSRWLVTGASSGLGRSLVFTVPVLIVIATVMAGVESSPLRKLGHIALMLVITFAIATVTEQGIQPLLFPA